MRVVTYSSCESEYVGLSESGNEVVYLQQLQGELGIGKEGVEVALWGRRRAARLVGACLSKTSGRGVMQLPDQLHPPRLVLQGRTRRALPPSPLVLCRPPSNRYSPRRRRGKKPAPVNRS